MLPPPAAARIASLLADEGDRSELPRARSATLLLVTFAAFLAMAFHAAPPTGSLATPTAGVSGSDEVPTEDPRMRFHPKFGAMAGAVALSVGGQAVAQDAVQWRVKDGGNGHWYQGVIQPGVTWSQSRAACLVAGGDLACFSSMSESSFVYNRVASNPALWNNRIGPWIGLYQLAGSPEPAGGWTWIDGTTLTFANWFDGHPLDGFGGGPSCDVAHYTAFPVMPADTWGVDPDFHYPGYHWENFKSFIIEWSADCNNDGLVDYGQIRAGELPDSNGNNIPDCCEQGVSCSPCAADIARDGVVNGIDLAAVLTNWSTSGGSVNADVNRDGVVNGSDLAIVLASWGPCP